MKAIVCLLFILLFNSKALGYSLPVPAYTVKDGEQQINLNNTQYTSQIYHSRLSEKETASFYKDALALQGFSLIAEEKTPHTLNFVNLQSKDHVFIMAEGDERGQTQISITSWRGDTVVSYNPQKDTGVDSAGSDLPGIPRYPGSVRISSVQNGLMKNATYRTKDTKDDIISFYESKMPRNGWNSVPEANIIKQKIAQFAQGNKDVQESGSLFYEQNGRLLVIVIIGECCGSKNNLISMVLPQEQVLK